MDEDKIEILLEKIQAQIDPLNLDYNHGSVIPQSAIPSSFSSSLPRYYDKLYSKYFGYLDSPDFVFSGDSVLDFFVSSDFSRPFDFSPEAIKALRISRADARFDESLPHRLAAYAAVAESLLKQAPRKIM